MVADGTHTCAARPVQACLCTPLVCNNNCIHCGHPIFRFRPIYDIHTRLTPHPAGNSMNASLELLRPSGTEEISSNVIQEPHLTYYCMSGHGMLLFVSLCPVILCSVMYSAILDLALVLMDLDCSVSLRLNSG